MPLEKYSSQCVSMGFLVDEQSPMIWRGPMVISAIKTMTQNVLWRDRDVIIVDMPPGTGDTQLTFAQQVKVDGAIIVSTPQDLALLGQPVDQLMRIKFHMNGKKGLVSKKVYDLI